jgi:hypothetical protein
MFYLLVIAYASTEAASLFLAEQCRNTKVKAREYNTYISINMRARAVLSFCLLLDCDDGRTVSHTVPE